jgi:hypothetical protein
MEPLMNEEKDTRPIPIRLRDDPGVQDCHDAADKIESDAKAIAEKDAEIARQTAEIGRIIGLDNRMLAERNAEIANLRARLVQIRGFVSVMAENNWRDLQLYIERQTDVDEQTAGENRGS